MLCSEEPLVQIGGKVDMGEGVQKGGMCDRERGWVLVGQPTCTEDVL